MSDLRVDLILRVRQDHRCVAAGTAESSQGEHHRCRCGASYKGEGALRQGDRHVAAEILSALDEAAVFA